MTINTETSPKPLSLKEKIVDEVKKATALFLYFGTWFCALAFLGETTLDIRPIPLTIFWFTLIKAALCAKFMLVGQAIFPIKVNPQHGIVRSLFIESIFYLIVVLALNYFEAGVEGLIHGKNFFTSLAAFGQANPLHVFAMAIVYWLIVWPYLIFTGFKLCLGSSATLSILFGPKKSN
jgi:hypothetical protein